MPIAAAAIVGFAFLLMELVWYRMLGPLLGGSTFTFGLILAIALLGIGLGGAAYAFWSGNRQATSGGFAILELYLRVSAPSASAGSCWRGRSSRSFLHGADLVVRPRGGD